MKKNTLFFLLFLISFGTLAIEIEKDSLYIQVTKIKNLQKRIDRFNSEIETMWLTGDFIRGHQFSKETRRLSQEINYKKGEAEAIINEGIICDYQGKYSDAIHLYLMALRIQKQINDQLGVSQTYNNLGLAYENQGKNYQALDYYKKTLSIAKKIKHERTISIATNNIGIIYMNLKKHDLALQSYLYCVEYEKKSKDEVALSDSYNNIGLIYLNQKKFDLAEKYFTESLKIRKAHKDNLGVCNSYNNLGTLAFNQNIFPKAKVYFMQSIEIGKKFGLKKNLLYAYQNFVSMAKQEKNTTDELKYFKLFVQYSDSIMNENNIREQTQDEMQYAFDQKIAAEKLIDQKKALKIKHEKHKQNLITWAITVVAILTFIFTWFLYKRWKVAKNQNIIIEEQKKLVEEKNRQVELKNQEIMDSITYAKRIQSAILPPERLVKEYLLNSFVLYKPKDIVAGDFYWIEPIDDLIIFAVADCTGHGVPGAMVSVVCHNALNRSVREFGLTVPGEILDKAREIIVSEFEKNDENVSDGMDISLCSLNIESMKLQWAGANSPLWLIKKQDDTIVKVSPNKQPIGKHISYNAFETQSIDIEKGDSIYLFTDGYADQFGGKDEKKFKSKNMRKLIKEIHNEPMHIQRIKFEETFEQWKGDFEQVDDVCVIGIQL